jgi:hypothetical protein
LFCRNALLPFASQTSLSRPVSSPSLRHLSPPATPTHSLSKSDRSLCWLEALFCSLSKRNLRLVDPPAAVKVCIKHRSDVPTHQNGTNAALDRRTEHPRPPRVELHTQITAQTVPTKLQLTFRSQQLRRETNLHAGDSLQSPFQLLARQKSGQLSQLPLAYMDTSLLRNSPTF